MIEKIIQNVIDRAKGIIAKPMPSEWYDIKKCRVKDDDDETYAIDKIVAILLNKGCKRKSF